MKSPVLHRSWLDCRPPASRSGWLPPFRRPVLLALLSAGLALGALPRAQAQDFGTLTTLYAFDPDNPANGHDPSSGLLQGLDGNFYGLTGNTVFQITPAGVLTTLHTFVIADGTGPTGTLVLGSDGNFYGTTAGLVLSNAGPGSTTYYGSVFQITPAGVFTVLHRFDGTDGLGATGLTLGKDGNFYGVGGLGIFRITPAGVLTNLYTADPEDTGPINSPLVQGNDGNFYGTTEGTGYLGDPGSVFRITPQGVLTTLYKFKNGSDGESPRGGLTLGSDGDFYGVTGLGGSGGAGTVGGEGTVFKVTRVGRLTTLYSFTGGADGGAPQAGLVQGSNGNFYGTTSYGHLKDGSVFEITPAGALTTLYSFCASSTNGFDPVEPLTQGSDGNLYGTTSFNNDGESSGTIFQVTILSTPAGPPVVTGYLTVSATQGQPLYYLITATNGPQSFAATGLPAGLSLDPTTGLISGSPALVGTTEIGLSATNSLGTGTATFTLTVDLAPAAPVITSPASASGQVGVPFSYQITAAATLAPSYEVIGLPTGLSVDATTGLISGTPQMAGTFAVTLYAINNLGTGSANLSLLVAPAGSSTHPAFFTGETSLGDGVYYLAFPNGNYFGYYSYLADPAYLYHFDLGYEYVIDAADGNSGVYLYDFASRDFFYTSPAFGFPYLYDFNLQSVVYYYPDPNNAGHYNTDGVRYFYDFNSGQVITK